MPKREAILILPKLNDCNGDLAKPWFVEWGYRLPGVPGMKRERQYKGLNLPSAQQRRRAAEKIIQEKTAWLKSGEYLDGDKRIIYSDEIQYRNEARLYGEKKDSTITVRTHLSDFLMRVKVQVNAKSYQSYQSKMRVFCSWMEKNNLSGLKVHFITRDHLLSFLNFLSEERELSRLTINKYLQILHVFFRYLLEEKNVIIENPVKNMPKIGKVVDQAPLPLQENDTQKLKDEIKRLDPQLWLACEFQYYCAIRPGVELRLMRIQWIDFERGLVRIPAPEAKNNKTQNIKIPSHFLKELKEVYYLDKYSDKQLFVFGKHGRPGEIPLGVNTMSNRFNRYRDRLGLSKQYKFYSWKHTGAIDASDKGMNPYDLKNHLRHSSLEITERYLAKRRGNECRDIDAFFKDL